MKARRTRWTNLRVGDLFMTRDDTHPLRVLARTAGGVLVHQGGRLVTVIFRAGVEVLRFTR